MANYNKVILAGNLTKDITLSYTANETAVAASGIAVNRKWKDKEEVMFLDIVCFGKQAETLSKYCSKGSPILLEGRLTLDQWQDKNGNNRSKHKMVVESFQFLSKAEEAPKHNPNAEFEKAQAEGGDDCPF